jgi:hypothetical protein
MGQPVDRDHEHVILDALDATRTNETQDSKRALRAHLRRRRDSQATCSRTRARSRWS